MRMLVVIFWALVAVVHAATEDGLPSIYGMQRLSVPCDTASKLARVLSHVNEADFDFLKIPRALDEPVDVLVAADRVDEFEDELRSNDIEFQVLVEDVSRVSQEETRRDRPKRSISWNEDYNNDYNDYNEEYNSIDFKSFPRYDEIQAYLRLIAREHSFAEYVVLGHSFEDREIMGLKFSSDARENKSAVLIDAGIHAREWLAPTTALYAIRELAENPSNHYLFEHVDIYVVPLVNPDGYEYTHHNETTRYWRKNRSRYPFTECIGADINRNFDLEWMTVGASDRPCSYSYAGVRAFSEPEARALRNFIWARQYHIKVYLTLHSYGQYFLHPWGFQTGTPPNAALLKCTAHAALRELTKVRGTVYKVGSSANVLYAASGGSDDWAMGYAGIPVTFTIELPPDRGNLESFHPPVDEIEPTGRETFEAFKVFISYANGEICTEHKPVRPGSRDFYEEHFTVSP